MYLRAEEQQFIDGETLKAVSLTGTAEEIRARVATMEKAGYDQMAIQLVPGQEAAIEDWARVLFAKRTRGAGWLSSDPTTPAYALIF